MGKFRVKITNVLLFLGQIAVSHTFKEQLELEAPGEVEYMFHEMINFMSLSKESNDLFTYITQPTQLTKKLSRTYLVKMLIQYCFLF